MVGDELMLKVENVSKVYKLGEIGGTTIREELQRLWAKIRKKEDPTRKIGAKNYNKGEKFRALDDISFEVDEGERIGIIGHNGAGKSTLLKLISRVTGPSSGTIYLNGRITSMLEVGTGFHPELTGRENVYMNGAILGMTKKEIDKKINDIIEFSEIGQFIDTPVKRYSSGMYVKLAFSVAAHLDSEIMIMDEVLAVGDIQFQKKCLEKMKSVSKDLNRTILYVSHNMVTIRELCTRVIVLDKGKIIYDGDVEKGIDIYSKRNFLKKDIYNLSDLKHETGITSNIFLTRACFVDHGPSFLKGKTLKISLSFDCKESLDNIVFRFILTRKDGVPIATFLSEPRTYAKNRSYLDSFRLDTRNVSPGSYYFRVVIFEKTNIGTQFRHDAVDNILFFDVLDDTNSKDIEWHDKYWGNLCYLVEEHSSKGE